MEEKPEEIPIIIACNHVDAFCWVRKGSPTDIYCQNLEHILNAIKQDGAISRNDVEKITSTFSTIQHTINTELFRDLSQFSPDTDRLMDPKHVKIEMCSVWSRNAKEEFKCTFLAKPDETCDLVRCNPLDICSADQVMELLTQCSDATKTTQCVLPDNVTESFDYINVVAAVMNLNLIKPGRPLYERVLFFPLGRTGNPTMGNLLLPKIKSGTLRLVNMGMMHDNFLHQYMGVYTSDFLAHLNALIEQHKKMAQVKQQQPRIKFY